MNNLNRYRKLSFILIAVVLILMFFFEQKQRKMPFPIPTHLVEVSKSHLTKKSVVSKLDTSTTNSQLTTSSTKIGSIKALSTLDSSKSNLPNQNENTEQSKLESYAELADAIIKNDPNSYFAYKTKLISLLLLELKFKKNTEPEVYDNLYNELLGFNDNFENQSEATYTLKAEELTGIDNDLIHLPFLRLSSLGSNNELAAMADDYINNFPNSYIGYLYMAEAFWNIEQRQAALETFKRILGSDVSNDNAFQILEQLMKISPIDRISSMRLE